MLQQCLQSTVQAPVGAVITEIVLSQDGKTLGNPTSLTPPFIRAKCTHPSLFQKQTKVLLLLQTRTALECLPWRQLKGEQI